MQTTTSVPIDGMVEVTLGTYLPHSKRLVRTRADFYDTVMRAVRMSDPKMMAAGKYLSPPSAGEEEAVYRKAIQGAKELRNVEELKDYFGNNDTNWWAWGWNTTGLRFRKEDLRKSYNVGYKIRAERIETEIPLNIMAQIADQKFTRDDFKDIIKKITKVVGTVDIPYARGQVIKEIRDGIFTEVESTTEHGAPYALHGWLREDLDVPHDPISDHYEVAVGRRSHWRHGERCLGVDADCGRWDAYSLDGFRPVVRGSALEKKIEKLSANVDIE